MEKDELSLEELDKVVGGVPVEIGKEKLSQMEEFKKSLHVETVKKEDSEEELSEDELEKVTAGIPIEKTDGGR